MDALIREAIAEEVAAELRHDLRNHLAAIRNAAFYLRRRAEKTSLWTDDPRTATFFELIATESKRADERVGEHAWSVPRSDGEGRVGAAIERAIDDLGAPEGVAIRQEVPPALAFPGSEDDLALAIRMILENAVDAIERQGEVAVSVRRGAAGIEIDVRDSGPGIQDPARATSPRVTTKPGHLGLGLPIAMRALRRLGGELELVPVERGACVRVRLPGETLP
jgi:signal transduction histidine kinase